MSFELYYLSFWYYNDVFAKYFKAVLQFFYILFCFFLMIFSVCISVGHFYGHTFKSLSRSSGAVSCPPMGPGVFCISGLASVFVHSSPF